MMRHRERTTAGDHGISRRRMGRRAAGARPSRPSLEPLENRTLLDAGALLTAMKAASATAKGFGTNLVGGPLARDLPVISGGASALGSILQAAPAYNQIGDRLAALDPAAIAGAGNSAAQQAALQSALGPGFTVTSYNGDSGIFVTYSRLLAGGVPGLSTTTNLGDFFGGSSFASYLTDLTGLAGSAAGSLTGSGGFSISFGADNSGFVFKAGSLLSNLDFSLNLPLTGDDLKIANNIFDVGLTNTSASLSLKGLGLNLTADVRGDNPGASASFSVNAGASEATLAGDFKLKVLGVDLVSWQPSLRWNFNAGGGVASSPTLSVPSAGAGSPSLQNQSSVSSALAGSLLNSLGLDGIGAALNPLASAPGALQDFISIVTAVLGKGLGNSDINPQGLLDLISNPTQSGSNFRFASPSELLQIVQGAPGVKLISYTTDRVPLGPDISFTPSIPLGAISILGILNIIPTAGATFGARGSAQLGFGIDTSGVFIDTGQTDMQYGITLGANFGFNMNVLGVFDNAGYVRVGPEFTTTAVVGLLPSPGSSDRLYLNKVAAGLNLDQSNSLGALGSWLADLVELKLRLNGNIRLTVGANLGAAAIVEQLPDGVKEFAKSVSGLAREVLDFVNGVLKDLCEAVDDVPVVGWLADEVGCDKVAAVASVAFGDLTPMLREVARLLQAQYSEPNGFGSFQLDWLFPILANELRFAGASNIDPSDPGAGGNQSQPADYISYSIVDGVLTINGKPGDDQIRVRDAGGGKVQLERSGREAGSGSPRSDPIVTLSGVTAIVANLGDGNDTFTADSGLALPMTVRGGAGDDTITTGAGKDDIFGEGGRDSILAGGGGDDLYGGDEPDFLDAGDGPDKARGDGGDDRIVLGSGNDEAYGGEGDDVINGDAGNDTIFGENGRDSIRGGAEDDEIHGGSGNDRIFGDGGTNQIDGDAGSDEIFAGAGNDIVRGGDDPDQIYGGPGRASLYGGGGADRMYGGPGANRIDGGDQDDYLEAGNGDATLVGGGGNDALAVYNGAAGVLPSLAGLLIYGGGENTADPGQPGDYIVLAGGGGAAFTETFTIGTSPRTGSVLTTDGATTQRVSFYGVYPVYDTVPVAALTVVADGRPNAIRVGDGGYSPGSNIYYAKVDVDGWVAGITSRKRRLNVEARGGDDAIELDLTNRPTDLAWTVLDGGPGNDSATARYRSDFDDRLDILNCESIPLVRVDGSLGGMITAAQPGDITSLSIGGSIRPSGLVSADNIDSARVGVDVAGRILASRDIGSLAVGRDLTGLVSAGRDLTTSSVGRDLGGTLRAGRDADTVQVDRNVLSSGLIDVGRDLDVLTVGGDMAGRVVVGGTLDTARIAGGTPGTFEAGRVGTIGALAAYGPIVLWVREAGTWRRVEAAIPTAPYPVPAPPPSATPPISPSSPRVRYFYESAGLASPQLTARVSNPGAAPQSYDLSLVTWSDTARFNLARLDAAGASGLRNVAVEGDLLTSVTPAAAAYIGLSPTSPGGVHLPLDGLAGVAVRDFAPRAAIRAGSIQGVAFGSYRDQNGRVQGAPVATSIDALSLLTSDTPTLVAADGQTFRVPFAGTVAVALFFKARPNGPQFDSQNVIFRDQAPPDPRGAITALVGTVIPAGKPDATQIRSIDLRGDGGAITTWQPVLARITSTGTLGDLDLRAAHGIAADITAPAIMGDINSQSGPISGTIQTTGLRTDPITGAVVAIPADLGRVLSSGASVRATTIQTAGGGISGRIISRGGLVSRIIATSGISGLIAAEGPLGAVAGTERLGGILSNGPVSGQIIALGAVLGDITIRGNLDGGRIAARSGIAGNLSISGGVTTTAAIVSGGDIGSASNGTGLSVGQAVRGIVAAKGVLRTLRPLDARGAAFYGDRLSTTDPVNAAAIDAIFADGSGGTLGFDQTPLDLLGLSTIRQRLDALRVRNGKLSLT